MKSVKQTMTVGRRALNTIGALCLCMGAISAQAADTWVRTQTLAHDVRKAQYVGEMQPIASIPVTIALNVRNKAAFDQRTADIIAGRASFVSRGEFMNSFAPSVGQVKHVVQYLKQNGFSNVNVSENHLLITADGSSDTIKQAFQAEMRQFNVDGRAAYANVTDAMVPQSLSNTISAVLGLQTVHLARTNMIRYTPPEDKGLTATEKFMAVQQAPGKLGSSAVTPKASVVGINPKLFPTIYSADSLPSATNATIGIITSGNLTQTITDLKSFASSAGYPQPSTLIVNAGAASTDTSGTGEWNMDSQSSLAAAGGTIKQMVFYNAASLNNNDLIAALNKAVTANAAKVINVSLGECENDASTSGFTATADTIFQTAVSQGQTFSVSTGDSGSYECGGTTSVQSYPAVSPYVIAVGGTTLSTNGSAWAGETVWGCSGPTTCPSTAQGGTGGGVSATEAAPSWQTSAGVLAGSTKRGVPDISFDGSPNSGALVLVNGANQQIGGTSLSAPLFTGFFARIQSANNNTLAFPAQKLYQGAAANPSWFHDVTSGTNGGYSAKTGWDYTTGYGSLIVSNFASAFGTVVTGGTPVANFTSSASGLTVTFTDTSTDTGGTIGSRSWNFGDGATSTATNPSHTYAAAGAYTVTETVTDSVNGSTNTKTASVTVSGTSTSSQLLGNTGFEATTASPWTVTTGTLCTNSSCTGQTAHSGVGFIWLDGFGTAHTETASQSVTIPAGKTSATLSFYLHIDSAETTTTTAYDKLTVQVLNSSGTVLSTLATYSNLNKATGYVLKTLSLNAYIGQNVTIKFTGIEDASLQTSFVLDDVTLTVQ